MKRKILTASDGMILTDGKNYGKIIYLAEGAGAAVYHALVDLVGLYVESVNNDLY